MSIKCCSSNSLTRLLKWAKELFIKHKLFFGHGSINAWDEAVFIASYVLRVNLYKNLLNESILTLKQKKRFIKIVILRVKTRAPLAYIIKTAWFIGRRYYIDRRVIIPRSPFGELINSKFKPWLQNVPSKILDLCTGSSCLAIACYYAFNSEKIKIDASDLSKGALDVAKKNLLLHKLSGKINLIHSDLFADIPPCEYDLIISNPPYVDHKTFNKLPKEFHFEPKLALAAGENGLEIVVKILVTARKFLSPAGMLIVEVGYLWKKLAKLYPHLNFTWLELANGGEGIFLLTKKQLENL